MVSRISGMAPVIAGGRRRFRGALHAVRTRVLDQTDASGNVGAAAPGGAALGGEAG
jgi:hypothetical protein